MSTKYIIGDKVFIGKAVCLITMIRFAPSYKRPELPSGPIGHEPAYYMYYLTCLASNGEKGFEMGFCFWEKTVVIDNLAERA